MIENVTTRGRIVYDVQPKAVTRVPWDDMQVDVEDLLACLDAIRQEQVNPVAAYA